MCRTHECRGAQDVRERPVTTLVRTAKSVIFALRSPPLAAGHIHVPGWRSMARFHAVGGQTYLTVTISYERMPLGAVTSTTSPSLLPTNARAIGDDTEIKPLRMSASASPTI